MQCILSRFGPFVPVRQQTLKIAMYNVQCTQVTFINGLDLINGQCPNLSAPNLECRFIRWFNLVYFNLNIMTLLSRWGNNTNGCAPSTLYFSLRPYEEKFWPVFMCHKVVICLILVFFTLTIVGAKDDIKAVHGFICPCAHVHAQICMDPSS
jgi:hypothetical protein